MADEKHRTFTEQDINIYAEKTLLWYNEHDSLYMEYVKIINKLIREKTKESRDRLVHMFHIQGDLHNFCGKYNDIAYMNIIMEIYKLEEKNKVNSYILCHGETMQELIDYYLKVKFQLWRLEFNYSECSDVDFIHFIDEQKVSIYTIICAIIYSNLDVCRIYMKVSYILVKLDKFIFAHKLLTVGISLYPNNKELLCMMVELCKIAGKHDIEEYYQGQISNLSDL